MKNESVDSQLGLSRREFGSVVGGLTGRLAMGSAGLGAWLGVAGVTSAKDELGVKEAMKKEMEHGVPRGLFSVKFGEFTIYSIIDGMVPMKRGLFSGNEAEITKVLEGTGQVGEVIPSPISAFLLKSEKKNILIDAGLGSLGMMGPGFGNLLPGLATTNTRPEDIDTLIVTHAHPDHIGGMLDEDGALLFPNAEVVISEKDVKFWSDAAIMAKVPEGARGAFVLAQKTFKACGDQLTQVAPDKEVAPGITMKLAAGHTPGHSILHIDGGGSSELLMIADTLHNTELHTALPDIKFAFDVDATEAAKTRRKIFDQLATDKALALCSHAHFPGLGRILRSGAAYRYSASSL